MMKKHIVLFFFLLAFLLENPGLIAQQDFQPELYYRVKIEADVLTLRQLEQWGMPMCHVKLEDDGTLTVELSGEELQVIKDRGVQYEVLIKDMTSYYSARFAQAWPTYSKQSKRSGTPERFELGSMAGQKTLEEVLEDLDLMQQLYPHLVGERFSIGTSIEGRPIWALWLGSNRDADDIPEVMYNSLIHAREPNGMMAVLYYMWWLLENYGTDPEATFILDNRKLAIIPVLNPDGYEFNRMTAPSGGGMHRKNRRNVGTTNLGVDLNRNFGPFEFWDGPYGGSSDNPNSTTYRGSGPFSEPETEALRIFTEQHDFRTAFNYHTFSNLLIHPYGSIFNIPQDEHIFKSYAAEMTRENAYVFGTPLETVFYPVRGATDDWMYGTPDTVFTERKRIISFTPEVGALSDGFWPLPERIIPLCQENLEANKLLAYYAGPELLWDSEEQPEASLSVISQAEDQEVLFELPQLYNYGRTDLVDAKLILSCSSSDVVFTIDTVYIQHIAVDDTAQILSEMFRFSIVKNVDIPRQIMFDLQLEHPLLRQKPLWSFDWWYEGLSTSIAEEDKLPKSDISVFPNPFISEITIQVPLEKSSTLHFSLTNSEGKEVAKMITEQLPSGEHAMQWSPGLLVSGIYHLNLRSEHQSWTKILTIQP